MAADYLFAATGTWYYCVLAAAGAVVYTIWRHWRQRFELYPQATWTFLALGGALAIVAGHSAHFLLAHSRGAPAGWFFLRLAGWRLGYSAVGAAAGALLAVPLTAWLKRLSMLALADSLAPLLFPANILAKTVCLLNGCCYGAPAAWPWAVCFPSPGHASGLTAPSHPAQLYSIFASIALYAAISALAVRLRFTPGSGRMVLCCLGGYLAERAVTDCFRLGVTTAPLARGLSLLQWAALALGVVLAAVVGARCAVRAVNRWRAARAHTSGGS